MPHPERAAEAVLGSDDGMWLIRSLVESAARAGPRGRRRRRTPAPVTAGDRDAPSRSTAGSA